MDLPAARSHPRSEIVTTGSSKWFWLGPKTPQVQSTTGPVTLVRTLRHYPCTNNCPVPGGCVNNSDLQLESTLTPPTNRLTARQPRPVQPFRTAARFSRKQELRSSRRGGGDHFSHPSRGTKRLLAACGFVLPLQRSLQSCFLEGT